ncbi:hypothetical protein FQN54_004792 [Arachnomyces sp. PD_36]|nr:hypothetical protein FQN54_004792 [Arachnomyces sp. PD_36]
MSSPTVGLASVASSMRKKRKLRHPRTARACSFCRKRKVRCSGSLPCEYCIKEEVPQYCDYGEGRNPPAVSAEILNNTAPSEQRKALNPSHAQQGVSSDHAREAAAINTRSSSPDEHHNPSSRRNSFDPPQMFAEDQHVGPTSGISFLYHPWNKEGRPRPHQNARGEHTEDPNSPAEALDSYGDLPQPTLDTEHARTFSLTSDDISTALERYFRFATPTYRFMHQPTLEKWAKMYLGEDPSLRKSQRACVLIACAQSLLYSAKTDRYVTESDEGIRQSRHCFQMAKELVDHETGPPCLASVQSRLATCLYLLSTFRMNACRFCFSFTATVLTSLGLHRKQSTNSPKIDSIEAESRKRVFWCAYVLDGYLSVMLGRPRILHDQDVDQPYPSNIDDLDLVSSEPIENLPHHGNLEAFIGHANLAKLMARNNDLLYPIQQLAEEQVLERSNEMLDALNAWRDNLPNFLRPGKKILTGERTFERQNTVLKLAHAHMQILITRRCLLIDTSRLGRLALGQNQIQDLRTTRPISEFVAGITTILDVAGALVERDALYHCFWFTQYIALVAVSTLYVFLIQGTRQALPESMESFIDVDAYFAKAKQCQTRLDDLAPPGSQAKRHHQLLDHLKRKVERDLGRIRETRGPAQARAANLPSLDSISQFQGLQNNEGIARSDRLPGSTMSFAPHSRAQRQHLELPPVGNPGGGFEDPSILAPLYSASDTDQSITNMLDFGWASLDTIGFMIPNEDDLGG